MASELHDGAMQLLAISLACLRRAVSLLERDHPALETLRSGVNQAQSAMEAMRTAVSSVGPGPPSATRLEDQVQDMIRTLAAAYPMSVRLAQPPDLSRVPWIEEAVTGIVREALTNAGKHAKASTVWVDVTIREGAVHLRVRDDGVGFNSRKVQSEAPLRKNLGLHLIRERARLAGGQAVITSRPNVGTVVEARLPLPFAALAPARAIASGPGARRDRNGAVRLRKR